MSNISKKTIDKFENKVAHGLVKEAGIFVIAWLVLRKLPAPVMGLLLLSSIVSLILFFAKP